MSDAEAKRKAALAEIDAEVDRLRAIAAEKAQAREKDTQKHVLDQDWPMQARLKGEIEKVNEAIDDLLKRRSDIEINGVPEQRSVQQGPRVKREWEIKHVPAPAYPSGARIRGDQKALNDAFDQFIEYHADQAKIAMQKHGVDPSLPVTMALLVEESGDITAAHYWMSERVKELEQRVAETEKLRGAFDTRLKTIEDRPTKSPLTRTLSRVTSHDKTGRIEAWEKVEGEDADIDLLTEMDQLRKRVAEVETKAMRYGGTWKEDTAYGLGTATTDRGSMWLAQRATTDRPGTSDAWRLIVKSGQVR